MSNMYGSTSMPPNDPSGAANANKYQTNISRQKTKKWVQASVPNYDGDDWGNDYGDEPEPEPQHAQQQQQHTWPPHTHPNSLVPGLGSRPPPPSESPLTSPVARKPSGPISLPSQGQQPAPVNRPGTLPSDVDPTEQERRSFSVGTTEAMADDSTRSPPPPTSTPAGATVGPQSPSQQAPAARFPPRKSSMGHKDGAPEGANFGPILQQGGSNPSSRPGSGAGHNKPWMEARSASPQGPRSPPQTGKPLPFVRPADIYKRLEEEKNKERRSLDSGRPSLDSVGAGSGAGDHKVESPRADNTEASRRTSFGRDEAAGELSPRGPRPQAGLETVAERKSEYGLEGYFIDSGMIPASSDSARDDVAADEDEPVSKVAQPELDTSNAPKPAAQAAPAAPSASVAAPAADVTSLPASSAAPATAASQDENGKSVRDDSSKGSGLSQPPKERHLPTEVQQPETDDSDSLAESDGGDLRRFSTSPKLPDFSRMSSFGLDMFGSSFASSDEPQPAVPAIAEQHQQDPEGRAPFASPLSQVQQSSPSPAASSKSTTPTPGPGPSVAPPPAESKVEQPAADAKSHPPPAGIPSVTEAANAENLISSPTASAGPSLDLPIQAPALDEADSVKPSAVPSLDSDPLGSAGASPSSDKARVADGPADLPANKESSQTTAEGQNLPDSSRETSRSNTPRDRTSFAAPAVSSRSRSQSPSKVQAMVQAMNLANAKAAGVSETSEKAPPTPGATSPAKATFPVNAPSVATAAPATAEVSQDDVSTPPAVSQRASPAPPALEPLEPVTRASTFETTATASPVKESDKLREEIILSLSPGQKDGEFTSGQRHGAAGPTSGLPRESTYLEDVYGDYYGGDDRSEEALPEKLEDGKAGGASKDAPSSAPMQKPALGLGEVPHLSPTSMSPRPLSPRKSQPSAEQLPALKHKFSWEAGYEAVNSPSDTKPPPSALAPAASPPETPEPEPKPEPEPQLEPKSLSIIAPAHKPAQAPALLTSPLSPTSPSNEMSPVGPGASNMSHQVSKASTLPSGTQLSAIEQPSPISVRSDDANNLANGGPQLRTLAEEKILMTSTSSPVSPPPREEHPAFAEPTVAASEPAVAASEPATVEEEDETTPTEAALAAAEPATPAAPPRSPTAAPMSPSAAKIAPFREIMALPTAAQRIERLDETREVFSKIDSGLASWLVVMTQVPENANASWSLRENMASDMFRGDSGANVRPDTAGAPGGNSGLGRPISLLASGAQFSAADLRHSGKEVGAKGKELLMAAGKAGKGLFSKGKSRFRAFER